MYVCVRGFGSGIAECGEWLPAGVDLSECGECTHWEVVGTCMCVRGFGIAAAVSERQRSERVAFSVCV